MTSNQPPSIGPNSSQVTHQSEMADMVVALCSLVDNQQKM